MTPRRALNARRRSGDNVTDPHKVSERPNSGKRAVPLIAAVADVDPLSRRSEIGAVAARRYGNPDGSAIRPALQTVADMAGLDERSIRRHVRAFETDGVLVVVAKSRGGRSKPSEYRLDLERPKPGHSNPGFRDTKPGLWCAKPGL